MADEIQMKVEIDRILDDYYSPEQVAQWWELPHPQLEGKTPEQVLAEGTAEPIYAMLKRLDEYVYL